MDAGWYWDWYWYWYFVLVVLFEVFKSLKVEFVGGQVERIGMNVVWS